MKKKRIFKIAAAVVALLMIAGLLFVYNASCGNIFSALYAKHRITAYIAQTYPHNSYQISAADYDFKTGGYSCRITDPDSEDKSFYATYSYGGDIDDTYDMAMDKEYTLMRIEQDFRDALDPLIDSELKEDENEREFGFATIFFGDKEIDRSRVQYDMTADPKNMPVETCVVLSLDGDETHSLQRVRQLAHKLASFGYRIDFYEYSNDVDYFEPIPTDRLLAAQSPADLAEFKLSDDSK